MVVRMVPVLACLLAGLEFFSATSAEAAALAKANEKAFCTLKRDGIPAVDPARLAELIVSEAGVPLFLLQQANPQGVRRESVTSAEILYVVTNASDNPFGPSASELGKKYQVKLKAEMDALAQLVSLGQDSDKTFKIITTVTDPRGPLASDVFLRPNETYIRCVRMGDPQQKKDEGKLTPNPAAEKVAALTKPILLRATTKDFTKSLDEAAPAKIGYTSDRGKNETSYRFDGVAGYKVGKIADWNLTPFVAFKHLDIKQSTKNDIHIWTPGLLADNFFANDWIAATTTVSLQMPFDDKFNSRQAILDVKVSPAVRLSPDFPVLFGAYLPFIGPLAIRPDIDLFVEGRDLITPGTDKDLAKAKSYYGAGFEFALSARFPEVALLAGFKGEFKYRYMQLFDHNLPFDVVERREAKLNYTPPGSPNYGIGFSYSKGRDPTNFKLEDMYGIDLTVKY